MKLRDLRARHEGETVWITGRGPSLQEFPWKHLNGRVTIAHNDSAKSYVPRYWYVTDGVVFDRCPKPMQYKRLIIIAGMRCRAYLQHRLKVNTILVDTAYFDRPLPKQGQWIHSQFMGVTGCLYLAWWMRAKRAYILGIDAWARKGQYYYDPKDHHHNRELEKHVNVWLDDNRFVAQVHVDRHIPALRACAKWLHAHCKEHDMEVVNLSIGSQHDAFPRADWRDVI